MATQPYINVLCYPNPTPEEAKKRLKELSSLYVHELILEGDKRIGSLSVLGKGCVGIVVKGNRRRMVVAVKIRRVDADRENMSHEAEMLRLANKAGVGPKLIDYSKNLLVMEYVEGIYLDPWVSKNDSNQTLIKKALRDLFHQCHRLDLEGLDHGELSNASKHIIIQEVGNPTIIDFESASNKRKTSNLTALIQYIFLRSSSPFYKFLDNQSRIELIEALGKYKRDEEKNFNSILEIMRLSMGQ